MTARRRSPLTRLVNSTILVEDRGSSILNNGRYESNNGSRYLVKAYLQRAEGDGTDDGELPSWGSRASSGGGITSTWLLRGYGIEYARVSDGFEHGSAESFAEERSLRYESILTDSTSPRLVIPMYVNQKCTVKHGTQTTLYDSEIVMIGGKYQGLGPDSTIYFELQGIPLSIRGSLIV